MVEGTKLTTGCIISCVVEDDVPADIVDVPSTDWDVGLSGTAPAEFYSSSTDKVGNKARNSAKSSADM